MQLISNWTSAWRMTSVNLPAIGLAIVTFLEVFPDAVLSIWAVVPHEVRALIDPEYIRYAGYVVIACGVASRIIRQPKLAQDKADAATEGR